MAIAGLSAKKQDRITRRMSARIGLLTGVGSIRGFPVINLLVQYKPNDRYIKISTAVFVQRKNPPKIKGEIITGI